MKAVIVQSNSLFYKKKKRFSSRSLLMNSVREKWNRSSNASEFLQILSRLKEVQEKLEASDQSSLARKWLPQHNRRKSDGVFTFSSVNLGPDADCHTGWLQSYGRTLEAKNTHPRVEGSNGS